MLNAIKYMDELEKNGFTQPQAKTSVNLWLELMNENLATKIEMNELRADFKALEMRIDHLNEKFDRMIDLYKWSTGITFGLFAGLYLKLFFG